MIRHALIAPTQIAPKQSHPPQRGGRCRPSRCVPGLHEADVLRNARHAEMGKNRLSQQHHTTQCDGTQKRKPIQRFLRQIAAAEG